MSPPSRTVLSAMASMALTTAQHLRVRAFRLGDGRLRMEVRDEAGHLESDWEGTVDEWNEALQSAHALCPPLAPESRPLDPERGSNPPA